jgi:light-harvesting complex II chlorophyll a/b binding protein 5
MASLAASTAAASLGVSEMLGNPLNFSGAARSSAPTASSPATFKTVALFSKKKASPPKSKPAAVSPADEELAKWYGKYNNRTHGLLFFFTTHIA